MPTQRKDQAVSQRKKKPAAASAAKGTTPSPKPAAKAHKRPSRSGRARAPHRDKSIARASATSVVVTAPPSEGTPPRRDGDIGTQHGPSLEQVSRRAYEIYLSRGQESGDAFTDWMRARAELESAAG